LDEAAGEIALRVDEDRTRIGQAEGLRGAAAIDVGLRCAHVLVLLVLVAPPYPAARAGEHRAARKLAVAIGELQLGRRQPAQAVGRRYLDGVEVTLRGAGIGPGVHRHHAADGSGNTRRPRDTDPPLFAGEGDEPRDGRAGAQYEHGVIAALLDRFVDEVPAELQDAALDAAVADDGVGAAAEREPWHSGIAQHSEHRDERLGI